MCKCTHPRNGEAPNKRFFQGATTYETRESASSLPCGFKTWASEDEGVMHERHCFDDY